MEDDEEDGDEGAGIGLSSTPGRVGWYRNKTVKMAVIAMAAISKFRNLLRLIPQHNPDSITTAG
jgi:hypothetical protein